MNKKRQAREFCFQYLFHLQLPIFEQMRDEVSNDSAVGLLKESISEFKASTNLLLDDNANAFIEKSIINTLKNYKMYETNIEKYLVDWKINRLSKVDHTILLLSVNELHNQEDTNPSIIINEAVEIAKKFGNEKSASFVNATLDTYSKSEI